MLKRVNLAADFVRHKLGDSSPLPTVGMMLPGNRFADDLGMKVQVRIPVAEIPGFSEASMEKGAELLVLEYEGSIFVAFSGNFRFPESGEEQHAAFPIRLMRQLNISHLLIVDFAHVFSDLEAELYILSDHANFMGFNPLTGSNEESWGPRFPDMSSPYDENWSGRALKFAEQLGLKVNWGVYAAIAKDVNLNDSDVLTHARRAGADMLGLSLVPWVIAAVHMNIRTMAVMLPAQRKGYEDEFKIPPAFSSWTRGAISEIIA